MDSNSAINLRVVNGIVGVALALTVGAMVLGGLRLPVPEWIGNAVLSITSGLIGYLSRDPKHAPLESTPEPPLTKETIQS